MSGYPTMNNEAGHTDTRCPTGPDISSTIQSHLFIRPNHVDSTAQIDRIVDLERSARSIFVPQRLYHRHTSAIELRYPELSSQQEYQTCLMRDNRIFPSATSVNLCSISTRYSSRAQRTHEIQGIQQLLPLSYRWSPLFHWSFHSLQSLSSLACSLAYETLCSNKSRSMCYCEQCSSLCDAFDRRWPTPWRLTSVVELLRQSPHLSFDCPTCVWRAKTTIAVRVAELSFEYYYYWRSLHCADSAASTTNGFARPEWGCWVRWGRSVGHALPKLAERECVVQPVESLHSFRMHFRRNEREKTFALYGKAIRKLLTLVNRFDGHDAYRWKNAESFSWIRSHASSPPMILFSGSLVEEYEVISGETKIG